METPNMRFLGSSIFFKSVLNVYGYACIPTLDVVRTSACLFACLSELLETMVVVIGRLTGLLLSTNGF